MKNKTFFTTVGVIFVLIFVLHLLRIVLQWEAVIGGLAIPFWASWIALLISGYLTVSAFRLQNI